MPQPESCVRTRDPLPFSFVFADLLVLLRLRRQSCILGLGFGTGGWGWGLGSVFGILLQTNFVWSYSGIRMNEQQILFGLTVVFV